MAAVTLGTETDGSLLCPASLNSVVGIKPTVGLTSRAGVIPISPRQDTGRPICRTVADVVHVLDAIVGYDELDAAATRGASKFIPDGGYMQFLKIDGLKGKRIGIVNGLFDVDDGKALQTVVNATISGELAALAAEFKLGLNAYLSGLSYSPVRSLAEIIAFNNAHPDEEMLKQFGQLIFLVSENTTGIGTLEKTAIQQLDDFTANGVEKVMKEHRLDAIAAPDSSAATVFAIDGLPAIAVPTGYDEKGAPFGNGRAGREIQGGGGGRPLDINNDFFTSFIAENARSVVAVETGKQYPSEPSK
ncbi:hypothetical protein EJB05_47423, partial [Eragrostis curvula]